MEFTGIQTIPATRQAVWDALNDPVVLKQCLPGCESVERADDGRFRVVVATAIGPLRARFNGVLRITEGLPPESCVIVFEGQGGAVGFGKGQSSVQLTETAEGTQLSYSAHAEVGGKLAQVGSRLIDSVARKMSDDFFEAFHRQLAPAAAEAPLIEAHEPEVAAETATTAGPAPTAAPPMPAPTVAKTPPVAAVRPPGPVMVPGWWLAVAAAIGSLSTLAGAWLH